MTPTVSDRTISTWDRIEERAAAHHTAEAARNALVAQARRAVYELTSLLPDLDADDRSVVRHLIHDEITLFFG